jgi:succinate dehydrogenase (ubiquinone) cytochrome b560 subunit
MQILVAQRLARPVAPHLTIYKPQLTWILSGLNRLTSILLSGPLYLFAIAYLAAPAFGWSLTSATLAAGFAKWPFALKVAAKAIAALPFTFHSIQGLRHLAWDTGRQLTNLQVIRTGQAAIGLTAVLTLALAFFV